MRNPLYILMAAVITLNVQCQHKNFDQMIEDLYEGSVPLIHYDSLQSLIQNDAHIQILDTRSKEEFDVSTIKGAQFIDYDDFDISQITNIDKKDTILVYCSVGYRSERIGEQLIKAGYTNVLNLYGGIFDWVNNGNSVYNRKNNPTDSVHTYNESWSIWLMKGTKVYE